MSASGIILAGGASRRMGRDKAWIEFKGRPLIAHVVERLQQVADDILIVSDGVRSYEELGVRVIPDILPGRGPLGGMYSGLSAARHDAAVVVACDMPFLDPHLLSYMLSLTESFEVVVPVAKDPSKTGQKKHRGPSALEANLHPLHAVYTRGCRDPIRARLDAADLRVISFYPDVRVRVVSAAEIDRFDSRRLSLFNANTPGQLELAERLAQSE